MNDFVRKEGEQPRKWEIKPETIVLFDALQVAKAKLEVLEAQTELAHIEAWTAVNAEHPEAREIPCTFNARTGMVEERVEKERKGGMPRGLKEALIKKMKEDGMPASIIEAMERGEADGGFIKLDLDSCGDPDCDDCGEDTSAASGDVN